jgi:hypothetical protein
MEVLPEQQSPAAEPRVVQVNEDTARDLLTQAHTNARAFMDLRFKHFTTYMVTVGLVGAAASRLPAFSAWLGLTCVFGFLVTCLFWRIDYRTGEYLESEAKASARYTTALGADPPTGPAKTWFGSGMVTSVLFALYADVWLTGALICFFH